MAQQRKIGNSDKSMTAVEWLINKLQNRQNGIFDGFPHLSLDEIYKQAKQMEKEQIMKAVDRGFDEGCKLPEDITLNNAEQYYNETYGNEGV